MSEVLDLRLLKVTFDVNGELREFNEDFRIRARGAKFANPLQNECICEISGLDDKTRNYIISETSPFNKLRKPKTLSLYAGRASTGLNLVYRGDITIANVGSPPEITLTLKCGTLHFLKGTAIAAAGGSTQKLSIIAGRVAQNLKLQLNMQARDRLISNYNYNGNTLDEVVKLKETGVDAFVDDTQLVLKEAFLPLKGEVVELSQDSGMLGVPNITEQGLRVAFLYTPAAHLGGAIRIKSQINPTADGLYVIYKLNFALSSRENEFQYVAECLKAAT